jgi:protocatechuate 3,4-dioxygenase beta subunit
MPEISVETDAGGAFELELEVPEGRLMVATERWVSVFQGTPVRASSGQETLIVVAPRIELAGVVIDEFGLPIAGARVELGAPRELRPRLAAVLDFSVEVPWKVVSDESGRFEIAPAPAIPGATLRASAEGFLVHEESAPVATRFDLVLACERPVLATSLLAGKVLDPAGAPVEGARVSLGLDTTTSDSEGRFSFRLDDPESFNQMASGRLTVDTGVLKAVKPGYLPGLLRARGRDDDGHAIWPAEVVVRLGGEPLVIAGHVVDSNGVPLAGIGVWVADPTFFGAIVAERRGGERVPSFTHMENELAGVEPGWHRVESDGEGFFAIEGLLERDYVLAAMDPRTLQRVDVRDVPAGDENVRITLPADELYPVLRGKVVDSRGRPVAGAAVFPMCDAFLTRVDGVVISTQHDATDATLTDPEGEFELRDVPRDLVYLRIESAETIPLEWGRQVEGGLFTLVGEKNEELVITVGRRCHFQVELGVPDEADQVGVLDAAGNELVISEFLGSGRRESGRQPLASGRSNMLAVADTGEWLVLYRNGAEVRRLPLVLEPGEPTTIRP